MLLSAHIAIYGLRVVAEMQSVGIAKTDLKSHSPMRTSGVACGTVSRNSSPTADAAAEHGVCAGHGIRLVG